MRTLSSKAVLVLAAGLFALVACQKDEAEEQEEQQPPPVITPTPLEVSDKNIIGSYRISKVEGRTGDQRTDITTAWFKDYAGNCAKDDLTTFKPDGSFVVLDGTITCDESTDDTGTWKVISKTRIKIDADTTTIEAFNSNTLRIVSPVYSTPQGDIIFTYTRQ